MQHWNLHVCVLPKCYIALTPCIPQYGHTSKVLNHIHGPCPTPTYSTSISHTASTIVRMSTSTPTKNVPSLLSSPSALIPGWRPTLSNPCPPGPQTANVACRNGRLILRSWDSHPSPGGPPSARRKIEDMHVQPSTVASQPSRTPTLSPTSQYARDRRL